MPILKNKLLSNNRKLIEIIFTNPYINKIKWIFKADIDWNKTEIKIDEYNYITWLDGTWKDGIWNKGTWKDGSWKDGVWKRGNWYSGTWENGVWKDGVWLDGNWQNGVWYHGLWKNGTWHDGIWKGGIWGTGKIYDHKLNKYRNSKLPPNKCKWSSSYEK